MQRVISSGSATNSAFTQNIFLRFASLDQRGKVIATYIWVEAVTGDRMLGKSKVLDSEPHTIQDLPQWDVCEDEISKLPKFKEAFLQPVGIYPDPFLRGNNILVLCEVIDVDGNPIETNHRRSCKEAMEKATKFQPWFGIEQEYLLVEADKEPLGWPKGGISKQEFRASFCAAGACRVVGRHVADAHLFACLYCGLKMFGCVSEDVPSQWEFQVGPCLGAEIGDHLWVARYLLQRVAEEFGVDVNLEPKPVLEAPSCYTTGAHCNFSTVQMRTPETGEMEMETAIHKLGKRHALHLKHYDLHGGEDNKHRLTAKGVNEFSYGVGNRGSSVRIPAACHQKGYGYIEDRRPAGNADPYLVAEMIVRTCCLNEVDEEVSN